jgi:hypothetical protein
MQYTYKNKFKIKKGSSNKKNNSKPNQWLERHKKWRDFSKDDLNVNLKEQDSSSENIENKRKNSDANVSKDLDFVEEEDDDFQKFIQKDLVVIFIPKKFIIQKKFRKKSSKKLFLLMKME